jgi:hypothetical protein
MTNDAKLCDELQLVLDSEIAAGNRLARPLEVANWPEQGSVFGTLEHDFKTSRTRWAASLTHQIHNDPHYGWYEECYCNVHKHLLVAGGCRQSGSPATTFL